MANNYIYGRNTVFESLNANSVSKIFCRANMAMGKLKSIAEEKNIPIEIVSEQELNELSGNGVHQGVIGLIKPYQYEDLDVVIAKAKSKPHPLIVMVAELNDPHNLGAIIRTCDAFSVDGIILAKHRQVAVTPAVMKVATGAHNYVPVVQVTNLNQTANKLKEHGFWLVGTDLDTNTSYLSLKYDFPCVLVIGGEGWGVPSLLKKNCDYLVTIPQTGHVNSLNASVAAGILIASIRGKQSL